MARNKQRDAKPNKPKTIETVQKPPVLAKLASIHPQERVIAVYFYITIVQNNITAYTGRCKSKIIIGI
jgi:hypothetical protein